MKVLHTITGLSVGGAENMLTKLIEEGQTRTAAYDVSVLSLMKPDDIAHRIRACGVHIDTLEMRQGVPSPGNVMRLRKIVQRLQPDLIVGWMHHAFLAASVGSRMQSTRPPVIWNVRHSLSHLKHEKPMTRAVLRACARISHTPAAIIYNSRVAAHQYEAFGFPAASTVIIPNGFDCDQFRPRPSARAEFSRMFGLDDNVTIVGLVARLHPMKQPEVLVEAVRIARSKGRDLHLLIMGHGADDPSSSLTRLLNTALPANRFTTIGHQTDVARWMPAIDIFALSSGWGEGFPNVIGEAMACGIPCVATDIGDSRKIIGNTGSIVPPNDPAALAQALISLTDIGADARRRLGELARDRVISEFSLPEIARQYEALYDHVLGRARVAPPIQLERDERKISACAG